MIDIVGGSCSHVLYTDTQGDISQIGLFPIINSKSFPSIIMWSVCFISPDYSLLAKQHQSNSEKWRNAFELTLEKGGGFTDHNLLLCSLLQVEGKPDKIVYKQRLLSSAASFVKLLDAVLWYHGTCGSLWIQPASFSQRQVRFQWSNNSLGKSHMIIHSRICGHGSSRFMTCVHGSVCVGLIHNQLWWPLTWSGSTVYKIFVKNRIQANIWNQTVFGSEWASFPISSQEAIVILIGLQLWGWMCFYS